jgi:sulfate adenylyltransferase
LTVLDGDVVRTHLSKGLTFSAEDRDTNILRIGYVAAEIAKHGGTVLCAAISPFRKTREAVRAMVGTDKFVEIYVATTLEEAEARDVKGLYAKARAGELKNFTGIDSPYEAPLDAEIVVPTAGKTPQECADEVVAALKAAGYLKELAR